MDVDNSVVIAGRGGGIRGLKGNVKNTIKVKLPQPFFVFFCSC